MSYVKTSVKYISLFFFFSFQPAAATCTQTGQNGRLILGKTRSRSAQSAAALARHLSTLRIFTVLLQTSGTDVFRNMSSFYSVIIVLCLLCISDLYLTLPVCLDKKTSFKPQLPSVSLILPQQHKRQTISSDVALRSLEHIHHSNACTCVQMCNTDKHRPGASWPTHTNTHRGLKYTPADDCYYQCTDKSISLISFFFSFFFFSNKNLRPVCSKLMREPISFSWEIKRSQQFTTT